MMHLFDCFTQRSGSESWHRVHAALTLTEEVLLHGSPSLGDEIASGCYFDVLQQLTFLENFEFICSRRAQNILRSKVAVVRSLVVPRLQGISPPCPEPFHRKLSKTSSDGDLSTRSSNESFQKEICGCSSDDSYPGDGVTDLSTISNVSSRRSTTESTDQQSLFQEEESDAVPVSLPMATQTKQRIVVNGIASVGHFSDTDSEDEQSQNEEQKCSPKSINEAAQGVQTAATQPAHATHSEMNPSRKLPNAVDAGIPGAGLIFWLGTLRNISK